jgi:hypothetical protein
VICICFEAFFGRLNKLRESNEPSEVNDMYVIPDPILGFKFSPGALFKNDMLVHKKDTIFNVCYSSDEYGRRIVPQDSSGFQKTKHAIFVGCSYTFGHGLSDKETIPFLFEKKCKNYQPYNFGFEAYAPNQIAWQFDPESNIINNKNVLQDSGVAIYTFINDHLSRVYGGTLYLNYAPGTPEVYLKNDSLIVTKRDKWQLRKAKFLYNTQTLKYFNFNYYYPESAGYFKRFADLLNYSAKQYHQKFKGNFYVAIYPTKNNELRWTAFLDPSIKLIRVPLPDDYDSNLKNYLLSPEYDLHPTGLLNRYYVNYISKYITKD